MKMLALFITVGLLPLAVREATDVAEDEIRRLSAEEVTALWIKQGGLWQEIARHANIIPLQSAVSSP